jgi:uncharacterized membrane protein
MALNNIADRDIFWITLLPLPILLITFSVAEPIGVKYLARRLADARNIVKRHAELGAQVRVC